MPTAIDIAILPPDPVKSLAIELSKKLSPDLHLNETDILPHVTLGIGFVEDVSSIKYYVLSLVSKLRPFEMVVNRMDGRYLMCQKSEQLFRLHGEVCDNLGFVKLSLGHPGVATTTIGSTYKRDSIASLQNDRIQHAYFLQPGEKVSHQTIDYTNNFKWRNAYQNWVPHITVGWDDQKEVKVESRKSKVELPVSCPVDRIYICQLGDKNTCRKILDEVRLGQG